MTEHVDVLDKGYVSLVHNVGSDLTAVNSARASYEKRSEDFNDRDARLLRFCVQNDHSSILRHCFITMEFRAPLMVARQHFKYAIGSNFGEFTTGWNEASRRYVTGATEFYVPDLDEWRSAPENSKQGSGPPISGGVGSNFTAFLESYISQGEELYERAMEAGICAEQARLFLPAYGLYVSYYWSASLQSVLHFLGQRLEDDAQKEIQDYAKAVKQIAEPLYPHTFEVFFEKKKELAHVG